MTVTAASLAVFHNEAARLDYNADEVMKPVLFLLDAEGGGITLIPSPDGVIGDRMDVPQMLGLIAGMMAPGFQDARYIGAITEAWYRDSTLEEANQIQRGDLGRRHEEGDTSVRTSILTMVLDLTQREKSATAIAREEADGSWEILPPHIGWPPGRLSESLDGNWQAALDATRDIGIPVPETIEERSKWLDAVLPLGFVSAALVGYPEPEPPETPDIGEDIEEEDEPA